VTVESVTYIDDLNTTYPAAGDAKSEGDDHLRNIKTAIKNTFPNIDAAVTPTDTELNYVAGVTSAIQTQLTARATAANPALTGAATFTLSDEIGQIGRLGFYIGASERAFMRVYRHTADGQLTDMYFGTMGSDRLWIDSSGNVIHNVNSSAPSLTSNSSMTVELTSNTSLKFVVRGSDGVTRSASLTLS
jgi:hypothetical protein